MMGGKPIQFSKKNRRYSFGKAYAIFRIKNCLCFGFGFGCVCSDGCSVVNSRIIYEDKGSVKVYMGELCCPNKEIVEGSFSWPNPELLENCNIPLWKRLEMCLVWSCYFYSIQGKK